MKKRILSLFLTLCMLLPLFPAMKAEAALNLYNTPRSYTYVFGVTTANEKDAGTNNDVRIGFIARDTSGNYYRASHLYDGDYSNNFDQNTYKAYFLENDSSQLGKDQPEYYKVGVLDPWSWDWLWISKGGKDGWKCTEVLLCLPDINGNKEKIYHHVAVNRWFNQSSDTAWINIAGYTKRNIKNWGTFDNWESTHYVSSSSQTGSISLSWDKKITDQYGTYNPYDYNQPPSTMSMSVSCNGDNSSQMTTFLNDKFNMGNAKFECTYADLYNAMVQNNVGEVKLQFSVTINTSSVNQKSEVTHTETVTIRRTCYSLSKTPTYNSTNKWEATKGSDYVITNSDGTATVALTLYPDTVHCQTTTDQERKDLCNALAAAMDKTGSEKLTAKLYSGNGDNGAFLCDMTECKVSDDGKFITFKGNVPAGKSTGDAGVQLVLSNAKITYNGKSYTPSSGSTTMSFYVSTLKVDTQKPTIALLDKDGKAANLSGKPARSLEFYPVSSEPVYTSGQGTLRTEYNKYYAKYKLVNSAGNDVAVTDIHNSEMAIQTTKVDKAKVTLETKANVEGVYKLIFTAYDLAGNPLSNNTVSNITLDKLAPRVTKLTGDQGNKTGTQKAYTYTVDLDDLCAQMDGTWARLYYCFVPDGVTRAAIPAANASTAKSQIISSDLNTWCFVEKTKTNSTVPNIVMVLDEGEKLEGTLWYFTRDSLGNESILQSAGVHFSNTAAVDTFTGEYYAAPKSAFNITFASAVDNASYTTKYKWEYLGNDVKYNPNMSLTDYTGGSVGGSVQNGVTMNGSYRLYYKVTSDGGNTNEFSAYYIFDNSNPTLGLNWNYTNTEFHTVQSVKLTASDVSGILTADYTVTGADGTAVGAEAVPLALTASAEGGNKLEQTVLLSPEKNGVYQLTFRATDNNNTTVTSNPAGFLIRNKAPVIAGINHNITEDYNGIGILNHQNYSLTVAVEEEMVSAASAGEQVVRYAVSSDGVNYSQWQTAEGIMTANGDCLQTSFTLASPVALQEGLNHIFVKVYCCPAGTANDSPAEMLVSVPYEVQLICDLTPPALVRAEASPAELTDKDVIVTMTVSDTYGYTELTLGDTWASSSSIHIQKDSDTQYTVTYSESIVHEHNDLWTDMFCLSDKVGNRYCFNYSVGNIDKSGPGIIVETARSEAHGARTDGRFDFMIRDENEVTTLDFALIDGEEIDRIYDELYNSIYEEYYQSEYDYTYQVYYNSFYCPPYDTPEEDANAKTYAIQQATAAAGSAAAKLVDEQFQFSQNYGIPMTESRHFTEEEIMAMDLTDGVSLVKIEDEYTAMGLYDYYHLDIRGLDGNYGIGIYAVDELGHESWLVVRAELKDAPAQITETTAYPNQTTTTAKTTLTFNVPVVVLNPTLAVEDSDEGNESILRSGSYSEEDYVMEYSVINQNAEPQKLYVIDEVGRTYTLTYQCPSQFLGGYKLDAVLTVNDKQQQNCANVYLAEDDVAVVTLVPHGDYTHQWFIPDLTTLDGLELDETKSAIADPDTVSQTAQSAAAGAAIYDKLVFNVLHNNRSNKSVTIRAFTEGTGISETDWQEYPLNFYSFDETGPVMSLTPNVTKLTNGNVTVEARFSDPESGIRSVTRTLNEDTIMLTSLSSDSVTLTENGSVTYIVENGVGLKTTKTYTVSNIDKAPITEGIHYSIKMEYQDYQGVWQTAVKGGRYRQVRATVVLNQKAGKTLSMEGQSIWTMTEAVPEYSFTITDTAGNKTVASGSWTDYDTAAGSILWELATTEKTNQPVNVMVTVTDDPNGSGIACVEIADADGNKLEWIETTGNLYVAALPNSGIYTVKAWDLAGNRFSTQITVSNINTKKPVMSGVLYSVSQSDKTLGSVLVSIQGFEKDGELISDVTVLSVEPIGTLTAKDIVHIPGSNNIRFLKNGSAAVTFRDSYGNENSDILGVSNIYTDPPTLEAVPVLSDDLLSVTVTFRQQTGLDGLPLDKVHRLDELTVFYNGITYSADKASFTLKLNGTYTFQVYDEAGNIQYISETVENIDDKTPVIQEVSWSYEYLEQDGGVWVKKTENKTLVIGTDTDGKEAGYIIATDIYHVTNASVNVTVTTDKATAISGLETEAQLKNTMVYYDNGAFRFNLKAKNGMISSYIVDVELIDKIAPEIGVKGASELVFIEGASSGSNPDYVYNKSMLLDYYASDTFAGKTTDLTNRVTIDYGNFDPENINNNTFDRSKPYTITYTVYDDAGNQSTYRRTIRLVSKYDTFVRINGLMPSSSNVAGAEGSQITAKLGNFSGTAYGRYAAGVLTMGQMKTAGTVLELKNNEFTVSGLQRGWYTVFIQTDKRDYFNITVWVTGDEG